MINDMDLRHPRRAYISAMKRYHRGQARMYFNILIQLDYHPEDALFATEVVFGALDQAFRDELCRDL